MNLHSPDVIRRYIPRLVMSSQKTHFPIERSQNVDLEKAMTTLLIILVIFLLLGGGGYYGFRGRW